MKLSIVVLHQARLYFRSEGPRSQPQEAHVNSMDSLRSNVIGVASNGSIEQAFLFQWFQMFDLRIITELGPTTQLNKKNLLPLSFPIRRLHESRRDSRCPERH